HPGIDSFHVLRIALLPVATYNNDLPSEKLVEDGLGMALKENGHQWTSSSVTREVLRSHSNGNDSLLKVAKKSMLEKARLDSLLAPKLCAMLRVDAILAARIDQWDQIEVEYQQSGKPSTTVQLKAALVDSSGALL